jgi:hypothetical protein
MSYSFERSRDSKNAAPLCRRHGLEHLDGSLQVVANDAMVAFYGITKLALVDTQDGHDANHRTDPRITGRALGQ